MSKRILILGAGVSGLSAGILLAQKGHTVTLIEKSKEAGGLAKTIRCKNLHLDLGPHSLIDHHPEVTKWLQQILPQTLKQLPERKVRFSFRRKLLRYPLRPLDLLSKLPLTSWILVMKDMIQVAFFKNQSKEAQEKSVESWAISSFGQHLYDCFFKPYTEQFWKMPANQLSARSIPSHTRLSFQNAWKLLFQNKKASSATSQEREKLAHYYPDFGYGDIPDALCHQLMNAGGTLKLQTEAIALQKTKQGWQVETKNENNSELSAYDVVISTIPIPALFKILEPQDAVIMSHAEYLRYRPILVLGIHTRQTDLLGSDFYRYYLNRPYNRIFDTSRFSTKTCPPNTSMLGLEIPIHSPLAISPDPKILFESCKEALKEDLSLKEEEILDLTYAYSEDAYPIYRLNYQFSLRKIQNHIQSLGNLFLHGRTGKFCYMDADECMLESIHLANGIKMDSATPQEILNS